MGHLIPAGGKIPQRPAFLAPTAVVCGDVAFGPGCSVWFGAVIRADINRIVLGAACNVQDVACIHVSRKLPAILGDRVSMGHAAIVHACTIGSGTLVGMGSRVLDGAVVGEGCLIAAGCVVPEGLTVPPGHLVAGVPGRVVKPLSSELQARIGRIAGDYEAYQALYPEIQAAALA
jgi:carbonic anhydrase/acetyltransferase-like protein (isoleucine patch superfamily)